MGYIRSFSKVIIALAVLMNIYIYTYPSFSARECSWVTEKSLKREIINRDRGFFQRQVSDIPYFGDLFYQYYLKDEEQAANKLKPVRDIRLLAFGDPQINGNWPDTPYQKRLDNYGNDYYLGHIASVMRKRLQPTHISVMGDLFSSQWILDSEYFNRTRRFLTRLFPQPERHTEYVLDFINNHDHCDWMDYYEKTLNIPFDTLEYDYEDVYDWTNSSLTEPGEDALFINITGNHDVGYSGDITWQHMARYKKLFGKDNYWIEYNKNTSHAWRLVVLNTMALEGPPLVDRFLEETWDFVKRLDEREFNGSTVLITHIPFYKREGLCIDGPYTEYYDETSSEREPYKLGFLRAQNFISNESTQIIFNTIFKNGKPGMILTGHDHEGCENYFSKDIDTGVWIASKNITNPSRYIKEVTVRSMMGEYYGNTGLMTGIFNTEKQLWDFHYSVCPFQIQHVWWATKIVSIIAIFMKSLTYIFKNL
ncbi:Ted1p [Ascoidea rubescens DSM 1968]|uniref:Phosphoesterase domain-containing protein n=1 Tax=Ascoidea rubescens DSM 1968 TaxID=1344418 RepID=A0A1D2VMU1_9ASCO|nr:phosphoesterase domain-containing protein [Ascoidea rubescens DSM 1968]ODV62923.1 phosphoesterase domain-containing protein [Ascoidea rubescens DSM 1968]